MLNNPLYSGMTPAEAMQSVLASNYLVLFLMMPLMVPVTIAAYSIVGEKITRFAGATAGNAGEHDRTAAGQGIRPQPCQGSSRPGCATASF